MRPKLYHVINGGYMKIGIDIGGNHIGVGLVDDHGNIIIKREKDLVKKEELDLKDTIIETIVEYINEIILEKGININQIELIGIAYPAALRKGIMSKAVNLDKIEGEEIRNKLKQYFNLPIYIKNDAKCSAICEKKYGSLKKYLNTVFLSIGTGIGGAIFLNDTLLGTNKNDLFEIGHIIIQKDGIECNCGKKGCFEKYASITALKREIIKNYSINKELTGKELYNFITEKLQDEKMEKIINEYIENLSIGISNIINIFEPEAISIGGSFSYYDMFLEKLEKKIKENNEKSETKILIAKYRNDAGIIGAANII